MHILRTPSLIQLGVSNYVDVKLHVIYSSNTYVSIFSKRYAPRYWVLKTQFTTSASKYWPKFQPLGPSVKSRQQEWLTLLVTDKASQWLDLAMIETCARANWSFCICASLFQHFSKFILMVSFGNEGVWWSSFHGRYSNIVPILILRIDSTAF